MSRDHGRGSPFGVGRKASGGVPGAAYSVLQVPGAHNAIHQNDLHLCASPLGGFCPGSDEARGLVSVVPGLGSQQITFARLMAPSRFLLKNEPRTRNRLHSGAMARSRHPPSREHTLGGVSVLHPREASDFCRCARLGGGRVPGRHLLRWAT
jgi:hypothetical protein